MTTIKIDVDENTLKEAEEVLHSIGMNVQIAVNVFLRRVTIEKGFPIQMTVSVLSPKTNVNAKEEEVREMKYQTRSNNTITREMVDDVWEAFLKHKKGLGEISRLKDDVAEKSGMNSGSAFIYLNILVNLIKGEPNTRTLKMKDLEYFMEKIRIELGQNEFLYAVQSLRRSIPYWREKLAGLFADHVEKNLNSIWRI